MKLQTFSKTTKPLTVLVNGINIVGLKLAEILLDQGSRVLIVDEFTRKNKKFVLELSKNEDFMFIDMAASEDLYKNLKRLDYVYFFTEQLVLRQLPLTNKEVLFYSNIFSAFLNLAVEFEAKFMLVSTLAYRQLRQKAKTNIQFLQYTENITREYRQRVKNNSRIVRLGEVYGKGMDMSYPTELRRLLTEVVNEQQIVIYGEGFLANALIHKLDAVYGLLKAMFTNATIGKTYILKDKTDTTSLNLAYSLLELTAEPKEVVFREEEELEGGEDLLDSDVVELSEIGWSQKIDLEKGLKRTLEYLYKISKKKWVDPTTTIEALPKDRRDVSLSSKDKGSKVVDMPSNIYQNVFWQFLYGVYTNLIIRPFQVVYKSVKYFKVPSLKQLLKGALSIGVILILLAVFIWLLNPFFQIGLNLYRIGQIPARIKTDITALDSQTLTTDLEKMALYNNEVKEGIDQLNWLVSLLPQDSPLYQATLQLTEVSTILSQSLLDLDRAISPYLDYLKAFSLDVEVNNPVGHGSLNYYQQIQAMESNKSSVSKAYQKALLAQDQLVKIDKTVFPNSVQTKLTELNQYLSSYITLLEEFEEVKGFVPFLLGSNQRVEYLFMFQNADELRSTGGWFTNYAVVGLENGVVRELTVDDVYNVEGQVGSMAAPLDMQQALGISKYSFSQSNWDPNMYITGKRAKTFLNKMGKAQNAQVIIAINTKVLEGLLDIFGPVKTEYGDVDSTNFQDLVVQLHKDFEPGSTNKTDLVSEIMQKLMTRIITTDSHDLQTWVKVFEILNTQLARKNIMVVSQRKSLNSWLNEKGWDSVFTDSKDFIFVVDWNAGGNKVNQVVNRSVTVNNNVADQGTNMNLTIKYLNQASSNNYPYGAYKSYVRIYLPTSYKIIKVANFDSNYSVRTSKTDYQEIGGWLTVPISSSRTLELGLRSPTILSSESFDPMYLEYKLNYIKQSGLENEALRVVFDLDQVELKQSQDFILSQDKIEKIYMIESDQKVKLPLRKKIN